MAFYNSKEEIEKAQKIVLKFKKGGQQTLSKNELIDWFSSLKHIDMRLCFKNMERLNNLWFEIEGESRRLFELREELSEYVELQKNNPEIRAKINYFNKDNAALKIELRVVTQRKLELEQAIRTTNSLICDLQKNPLNCAVCFNTKKTQFIKILKDIPYFDNNLIFACDNCKPVIYDEIDKIEEKIRIPEQVGKLAISNTRELLFKNSRWKIE